VVGREIGLEVNVDKTKYMVMSRDQKAGESQSMNIGNSAFERMKEFKYLETALKKIKIPFRKKLKEG
jgi:hypothetical protein